LTRPVQLQAFHEKGGNLTEFAGFKLPLWFKGIIPEALAVRNAVGIFDISHMGRAVIRGKDSQRFLDKITTNDVASLNQGLGQYSLLCNPEGGIKDDVLVFNLQQDQYLIVYNAANRSADYDWFIAEAEGFEVEVQDVSDEVAMFAVQGPQAVGLVSGLAGGQLEHLPRFGCAWAQLGGCKILVSRTGYTGEDGFEIFVFESPIGKAQNAENVWGRLLKAGERLGIEPCGLGARDVLRLEAGLCLYGTDMDEKTNPFEARLGFVVKLHKEFIGRSRLEEVKRVGPEKVRVGLVTDNRVIPRHGFSIRNGGAELGLVTSGTLSPVLNTGIAMGYVKQSAKGDIRVKIQIRERLEAARVVRTPFYDTTKYGYARKKG
jgi:aminomethyltransferase